MQKVLLTGASGGIGSVIKGVLEKSGCEVVAPTREECDLSSYDEIKMFTEKIDVKFDWLIFAHGYIDAETDIEKQSSEAVRTTFELNILSNIYLTQTLLKHLNHGGIIFISSNAGVNANGFYAAYSASKAAVNIFAQALARNKPDHSFYSVCPGPTATAMRQKIGGPTKSAQKPQVVADIVRQLVDGDAGYKSGDVIMIRDGVASTAGRI